MIASPSLHQLIHSLSPSELRYFRAYAARSKRQAGLNYLILFEEVLKQGQYDEEEINNRFSGSPIGRNLSSEKVQLARVILRSMREFHAGKGVDTQLQEMVGSVNFLLEKRMLGWALKIARKAKKKAKLYERHTALLDLIQIEQKILKETATQGLGDWIEKLGRETSEVLTHLSQQSRLNGIHDRLFVLIRRDFKLNNPDWMVELEEIEAEGLLRSEELALTFHIQYFKSLSLALIGQLRGDFVEAHRHFGLAAAIWEDFPHFREDKPQSYQNVLFNYLGSCHMVEDYGPFPEVLERIRAIPAVSPNQKAVLFGTAYYNEMLYFLATGQLDAGAKIASEIEEGLASVGKELNQARVLGFYANLGILFFLRGDFSISLKWLRKIFNLPAGLVRRDILRTMRLLELAIYFEQGELELLEARYRSAYRFFLQEEAGDPLEAIVLKHLRRLGKLGPNGKPEAEFVELRKDLETLFQDNSLKSSYGLMELRAWLDSRIMKISIKEVVEKEVSQKH